MKAIDNDGGIDNYLLRLDEKSVMKSGYIIKQRELITAALFHKGELSEKWKVRMGYDKVPPPVPFTPVVKTPVPAVKVYTSRMRYLLKCKDFARLERAALKKGFPVSSTEILKKVEALRHL
jgi:hypothetical protein